MSAMNSNATLTVQRLDRATDLAVSTGLPIKCLVFPATGGVQAIDAAGTILPLVGPSGSMIPSADNVDDLGSLTLRWRAGYFGTSVATPQLSTLVGGARVAVASLASAASAVNTVLLEGAATGNAVTVGAYSVTDTNVTLRLAGQNAGAVNLFAGGGTVIGVQNVSSTFFGIAAENVQNVVGGAVTVDAVSGSFRVAAGSGAAGIVITNNRVRNADSIIIAVPKRVDATIGRFSCLAASGSFTFTSNANATVDTDFQFIVINAAV